MFTRKKTESQDVIDDLMDFCVKMGIENACSLRLIDRIRYDDLLIAVSEVERVEFYLEIQYISEEIFKLRFRSGDERDNIEDLIKSYVTFLDEIPQLGHKINEMIESAHMDYKNGDDYYNPCAMPRSDVLDLIADDNRERARSLRGI